MERAPISRTIRAVSRARSGSDQPAPRAALAGVEEAAHWRPFVRAGRPGGLDGRPAFEGKVSPQPCRRPLFRLQQEWPPSMLYPRPAAFSAAAFSAAAFSAAAFSAAARSAAAFSAAAFSAAAFSAAAFALGLQMLGQPLEPRLLDPPVLDFRRSPVHEPFALEAPVKERALANVGLQRGDAVALARDRLCRQSRRQRAHVELTLRPFGRVLNFDRRARRRSGPEFQIGRRRGDREPGLEGELAQIQAAAERGVPMEPRDRKGAELQCARTQRDRRRSIGNRQRPLVELVAERIGDVGLVQRGVGRLRLGDDPVERGRIASRQRRAGELRRSAAGEALDQRSRAAPGRGEFKRPADPGGKSRSADRQPNSPPAFPSPSRCHRRGATSRGR